MLEKVGDFFGRKKECVGAGISGGGQEGPTRQGVRPGRGPTLVTTSLIPCSRVQVSWITFGEKIMFPKILFRLDSV